jgi:hypothetical protein
MGTSSPANKQPVPPCTALNCPHCRRYNKEALRLRIFYLLHQPPGAESHTVLVQDVPGVAFGTIPQRADGTLLKIIPKSEWKCTAAGVVYCWSVLAAGVLVFNSGLLGCHA